MKIAADMAGEERERLKSIREQLGRVESKEFWEIIDRGRRVIRMEGEALAETERRLGESFARAVDVRAKSNGRAIVAGVGKPGPNGRKNGATRTRDGHPATTAHPAPTPCVRAMSFTAVTIIRP